MRHDDHATPDDDGLSRRDVLRRLGFLGAAAAVGPAFLAACSSDKKSAVGTGTGSTTASSTAGGGDLGKEILDAVGINSSDKLGGGTAWSMGAVLALTGNGSFYGKTMTRGIDLAVKHIKAAGGPDIKVVYKDHKSGDPQAGTVAMTELGTSGIPAKLASYGDDILAMLPLTQQYKCFTLDGGGANGGAGQAQPYFWGARALPGLDVLPGLYKYFKEALPTAKTIGVVGWDLGAKLNQQGKDAFLAQVKQVGLTFNGLYELSPPNSTDFSNVVNKVKANQPDILIVGSFGQDPGFFADAAQTAGLKTKMFGYEYTPDGVNASKGAYDSAGWTFASDYFDINEAKSKWAKLFAREFKKEYKDDPDFYAANYYEDTFAMWDMIRRVLAKGGNINSGTDLENAMKDKPSFTSVYGGDDTAPGTVECDATTHSVKRRQMGIFERKGGKVTAKAYFNIGAADFKVV